VDQDQKILDLKEDLKAENTSLLTRKKLKKLVTRFYVQIAIVIRSAAKSSLPIKNPSQNPISYRSKATKL
jgi:hypothetical protein